MSVRVLVVDDHPVVREGLRAILSSAGGIEIVGVAQDGASAVREATRLRPDVVLMDLQMPDIDGATATRRILAAEPGVRVLVLTTYDTDADVTRAIDAGAAGFLLKDTPPASLVEAIRATARGEAMLTPRAARTLLDRVSGADAKKRQLTGRELEVLTGVARGESNGEIARALRVSEATVKTHLLHVFEKLGVDDRTAAVTHALARGMLRVDAFSARR